MEAMSVAAYILKAAALYKDYYTLFKRQALTSEDVLAELTAENLREIGITNSSHIERIIVARDRVMGSPEGEGTSRTATTSGSTSNSHQITEKMIVNSVQGKNKRKFETPVELLARIAHLTLTERKINSLENLYLCPNVQILHLYDNRIKSMVGLEALPNLKILYL